MPDHPDLEAEQEFLNRAHDGLESMRGEARHMLQGVLDLGRGGTFQSRTERDIVVRTSLARLEQLDIGDQALYFGRIDRFPDADDPDGSLLGESFHIGRLAVSGPDHEPLVVDWRAPVAEPFYRATGLDPQGLARRRHLAVRGRTVLGLEDEYFVDPTRAPGAPLLPVDDARPGDDSEGERLLSEGMVLGGPGALLSALGQARTGHMGDIIGTIQREQDEIIRSPLTGVLVVQGGPGTGKTAVALHRAAYLLYTHRFPLERQGVLVVGPNPLFLRYIEQVLPSLGETGVSLSTVAGLVPEVRVRGVDNAAAAKLKGDVRMVEVLARAVRTRQRPLRQDVQVPFGAGVLRLRAKSTEEIVAMARRRPGTHNVRRRFVEAHVLRALSDDYRARQVRSAAPGEDDTPSAEEQADLAQRLRRTPQVAEALDRMWPRLSPHELLHDLFGARPLLSAAGQGTLSPAESAGLYRPRSATLEEVPWTVADTALIDEARTILGPRRGGSRLNRARVARAEEGNAQEVGFWPQGLAASPMPSNGATLGQEDDIRSFGHIVVDEVQDLSPLQLRMLARRSLSGSMTVVGDIAQATGPWAPQEWDDVTRHLTPQRPPRLVELTVSYRTPSEVVALAAQVLAVAAPSIAPPRPVRQSGNQPRIVRAARATLAETVAQVTREEVAAVAPGRVAVLGPAVMLPELARALSDAGLYAIDPRDPTGDGLAAGLVLLPADETNGLEFDAVVVVEPALVAAVGDDSVGEGPPVPTTRGLRTLYVAMTRPTRRLAIVHAEPLPVDLVTPPG
ncbi:MAG TPA: UvrD-helicase domain-containing protein [Acidimicrobiales bacterium]|nr:UvrD-helicase domain-containing protein [Acidimicrobiales bacterium]